MSRINRPFSILVIEVGLLLSLALFVSAARADDYVRVMSPEAKPTGDFKLCDSDLNGHAETFSCREYQDDDGIYLLLFKGGPLPKAVYYRRPNQDADAAIVHRIRPKGKARPYYEPERPDGVPADAMYRGTGVCLDAHDRQVPCSVFEHAAARQPEILSYMVFYDQKGAGPIEVDIQVTGRNRNALVAELAFQLGMALRDTACCQKQAEAYLAYAHQLFPDAAIYGEAYRQLAANVERETEIGW